MFIIGMNSYVLYKTEFEYIKSIWKNRELVFGRTSDHSWRNVIRIFLYVQLRKNKKMLTRELFLHMMFAGLLNEA